MALIPIPGSNRWSEVVSLTADGSIVTAANAATASGISSSVVKIVVHSLMLVAGGTETLTLDSGSTARTGAIPLVANTGFVLPESDSGWMSTSAGENLAANVTTGGVQISGIVTVSFRT